MVLDKVKQLLELLLGTVLVQHCIQVLKLVVVEALEAKQFLELLLGTQVLVLGVKLEDNMGFFPTTFINLHPGSVCRACRHFLLGTAGAGAAMTY